MANIFRKNLYLCFSKIKCLPTNLSPPLTIDDDEEEDEDYTLFPTNPSYSVNSASSFLLKNFNSLYNHNDLITPDSNSKSLTSSDLLSSSCSSDEYSDDNYITDIIPDFSSVFASERFFFSSPGNSNSIIESPGRLPEPESSSATAVVSGGVAIQTYSPNPFADFRKSMQEMVEAHGKAADWDFLHELLSCYLSLNPKHTHKYIIGAFTDLIVSLMSATTTTAATAAGGGCLGSSTDITEGGHHQNCPSWANTSQPLV